MVPFFSSNYFSCFKVTMFITKEPRLSAFQIKYVGEDYFDMVRDCLCHAFSLIVVYVDVGVE